MFRQLQQRFNEHVASHFEDCNVSPSMDMVMILGKEKFDRLLTLEALFIAEI